MENEQRQKMPFVAPVRPANLVWIVVLAGGWIASLLWGTPHLRVSYQWNGRDASPYYYRCHYWGLSSFEVRPTDGTCPLFVLARKRGA